MRLNGTGWRYYRISSTTCIVLRTDWNIHTLHLISIIDQANICSSCETMRFMTLLLTIFYIDHNKATNWRLVQANWAKWFDVLGFGLPSLDSLRVNVSCAMQRNLINDHLLLYHQYIYCFKCFNLQVFWVHRSVGVSRTRRLVIISRIRINQYKDIHASYSDICRYSHIYPSSNCSPPTAHAKAINATRIISPSVIDRSCSSIDRPWPLSIQ